MFVTTLKSLARNICHTTSPEVHVWGSAQGLKLSTERRVGILRISFRSVALHTVWGRSVSHTLCGAAASSMYRGAAAQNKWS